MPDYFSWGEFETSPRTVGTGTVFSDWDGDADGGRSPGVTVAENDDGESVIRLGEPEYEIIENWEDSTGMSYDLGSSDEQTVSLSYNESFSGDLSLLLEHDDGYSNRDFITFDHLEDEFSFDDKWMLAVNWWDLTDGSEIFFPQLHYSTNRHWVKVYYDKDTDELVMYCEYDYTSSVYDNDSEERLSEPDDEFLYGPVVSFYKKHPGDTEIEMGISRLSELSDQVYLSEVASESELYVQAGDSDRTIETLRIGAEDMGGGEYYTDYWILDVDSS